MPPHITALGQPSYQVSQSVAGLPRKIFEQEIRWQIAPRGCNGVLVQRIERDAKIQFSTLPFNLTNAGICLGKKYRVEYEDYWECWTVIDSQAFPFKIGGQVYFLPGESGWGQDFLVQALVWGDVKAADLNLKADLIARRDDPMCVHDVYSVNVPNSLDGEWKGTWKIRGTVYFLNFDDDWLKRFSLVGKSGNVSAAGRLFSSVNAVSLSTPPAINPALIRYAKGEFARIDPPNASASITSRSRHVFGRWRFHHPLEAPTVLKDIWDPQHQCH